MVAGFFSEGFRHGVHGQPFERTGRHRHAGQPSATDPRGQLSGTDPCHRGGCHGTLAELVPAGALLLISAAAIWYAFGFGVFTMFPIAMCGLGGILPLPPASLIRTNAPPAQAGGPATTALLP